MNIWGYGRVSTSEQHDDGAGLPAQIRQLELEAERRGWTISIHTEDTGASAASMRKRPMLQAILADLDSHGGVLVVTKLDRLTRSVADFAAIVERSRRHGWQLVVIDLGVDTTTPGGELVATMMASVAQWERRVIGERTKAGMAERKRQGVHCGRGRSLAAEIVERIVAAHQTGQSLSGIARDLNTEEIPTAHGGRQWHASTVKAVLASTTAAAMMAA
jgi:DNA invertase Pin-like site-specific DNA recombinase